MAPAPLMSVADALKAVLDAAVRLPAETVPLAHANGRTLAADLEARRTQPPFPASAMDGYALRAADAVHGARLAIIGESAAGRRFDGAVGSGQTVRIFTGAPVPDGADAVLMQENAARDGSTVVVQTPVAAGTSVRVAGNDFSQGDRLLARGRRLDGFSLALAGAMGHGEVCVVRRPRVAILATGDELVPPGALPGPDQIVASNTVLVAALVEAAGGEAFDLGIAADQVGEISRKIDEAQAAGADLLVTLGGASVGDHDLVRAAMDATGFRLGFWRIAMRPGKPLIHGFGRGMTLIGLPGNPVSSAVCTLVFLQPLLRAMQGDPQAAADRTEDAVLGEALPANADRQDYVRATIVGTQTVPVVRGFPAQDSSMLSVLAHADALIMRPPFEPARPQGSPCRILRLRPLRIL